MPLAPPMMLHQRLSRNSINDYLVKMPEPLLASRCDDVD